MLGYILCEKGMIYKGIKYKENGVYTRVDGFIVFLNLESLITNMWDKMKLNIHTGASFVIARRGMNIKDTI